MNKPGTASRVLLVGLALSLGACAGRTPNPLPVSQIGDEGHSCEALAAEISQLNADIARKRATGDKTAMNIALGIAGWFLLFPWFFMDFSNSDNVEADALQQRVGHLNAIAADKKCGGHG